MERFPVKLPALWRQAFPGLVLGAVVGRVSLWVQGQPFSWPATLPLMAVAAVMVVALYVLTPTLAGPAGLKVTTFWGIRRPLAWGDVVSARLARLYLVVPSIELRDARGRRFWISRDTRNLARLHALARAHGGPAHPLTRVLETPLHGL
jgi:hypothetical protein